MEMGPSRKPIQLVAGKAPRKTEALAVVVDYQNDLALILPQFYHYMRGSRMLFDVM